MTSTAATDIRATGVQAPPIGAIRHRKETGSGSLQARLMRFVGRSFLSMPPSTWLLFDLCVLITAVQVSYATLTLYELPETPHLALWQAAAVFAFAVIIASMVFGLYERETLTGRSHVLTRMFATTACAAVIAYAIIYVIMYATVNRRSAALTLTIFFTTGSCVRLLAISAMRQVHRGLLVVGPRTLLESFRAAQKSGLLQEYRLAGYASTEADAKPADNDPEYLGDVNLCVPRLNEDRITDVVLGSDAAQDPHVMDWMAPCLQSGCRVTNEATFYEKATGQILVDEITPYWFLFADLKVYCDQHATLKRIVDLVSSGIGLCLTAPFWPLIAMGIKLCDGGPVFYAQQRVGQNGRVFRLYKFRTMRTDAENGRSVWASPNDPRVTWFGRFLRRSRLDELPQLYNILVGDMSIVGPRPERPDIVQELAKSLPYYAERHLVKPGLTGWAQINFRYGASIEDAKRKLQFDLFYLKHMSFELDAVIILRTIGTFLKGGC